MLISKTDFLKKLFQSLNENKLDYFVYGEYKNLPENTGESDLDIVLNENSKDKFQIILAQILKDNKDIVLASYYTNLQTFFYRLFYHQDNCTWGIQIDVVFKGLYHQNKSYYPTSLLKDDIILHNKIKVLEIKKAYYIGFLKEVLHTKKAKDKYIIGFLELFNKEAEKYKKELKDLYGEKFVQTIIDNNSPDKLKPELKTLHLCMYKSIHTSWKNKILVKKTQILRLIKKRPGYVIAVLGTDGSGKSTIINALTPFLNESFHHTVFYKHLKPGWLPDLGVILKKRENKENKITDPHQKKQSNLVISFFRWLYYLIDYTLGYLFSIYIPIHSKSHCFIFDRYYYDYYIDQKRLRIKLPLWLIQIGDFFVPKPDLVICLGSDAEKIYQRKPETTLEEVNRQVNELKKLANKRDTFIWIDTGKSIEESIFESLSAIRETFIKRNFKAPYESI